MDKDEIRILVELATIADSEGDVKTADSIDRIIRTSVNIGGVGVGGASAAGSSSARNVARIKFRVRKNAKPGDTITIPGTDRTIILPPGVKPGGTYSIGPRGGIYDEFGNSLNINQRATSTNRSQSKNQSTGAAAGSEAGGGGGGSVTMGDVAPQQTVTVNTGPSRQELLDIINELKVSGSTVDGPSGPIPPDRVPDELADAKPKPGDPTPPSPKDNPRGFLAWFKKYKFIVIPLALLPILLPLILPLFEQDKDDPDPETPGAPLPVSPETPQYHPSEYEGRQRVRQQVPDTILETYIRNKVKKGFLTDNTTKQQLYRAADAEKGRNFANSLIAFIGKRLGYGGTFEEYSKMPGITSL